jgi:alanine-synthesizing transaminase
VQLAMPSWLVNRRSIQAQILERSQENLGLLERTCDESPGLLRVLDADAGWSAVLALPQCVGEIDCAERLVRERAVVVHPGGFYGMPERNRIVVSLIGPAEDFSAGIQAAISEGSLEKIVQVADEHK